jgi:hypothetical protein
LTESAEAFSVASKNRRGGTERGDGAGREGYATGDDYDRHVLRMAIKTFAAQAIAVLNWRPRARFWIPVAPASQHSMQIGLELGNIKSPGDPAAITRPDSCGDFPARDRVNLTFVLF